jgi:selenide,water dikinase
MTIRLTQTVLKGGCAAKISAEVLRETLGTLNFKTNDPNVLIDGRDFDDAGIYQVSDEIALVQTLDFFTPIVDTPFLFGQVAAANALSDVYAMGGKPKTALAILAFPLATLDPSLMREILAGANEKVKESGATILGGHSIDDDTIKFGLSVTGIVHPKEIWLNKNAKIGDHLILTKALGTGTLMAGLKASDFTEEQLHEAMASMSALNTVPELLSVEERAAVHAATDITGFGILGHAMQVAKASQVTLSISHTKLPILEHALHSLSLDNLTRAHQSNRTFKTWMLLKFLFYLILKPAAVYYLA